MRFFQYECISVGILMELSSELANFDLAVITVRSFNQCECAMAFARPLHKFWDFHRIFMGLIIMMKAWNGILMSTLFIVIVITISSP